MKTAEIRKKFLSYFAKQGHLILPSSPVVPQGDPTLLFTNAGMNQFKDIFLGKAKAETKRAATSQKCIRVGGKHNDLDNVGHTTRHLTFFEMLGNFSFGDYFKKEAIRFAFEVSTEVFQIDPKRIWASVFENDDEALELWAEHLPRSRIVKLGAKDNFWAMGDTGPCGPCSELLFDRGEGFSKARSPIDDAEGERFFEFWNLVFMQYNKDASGKESSLPSPCIDTGMGLERLASLMNNVSTVFETDIFQALIRAIETKTSIKYEANRPAFHVIADHLRSLAFAISDGAQPSNVERGYVLRKILRRATRYARQLRIDKPFMASLIPTLLAEMGEDYPELIASQDRIGEILTLEEENFLKTLSRGGNILNTIIDQAKLSSKKEITGEDAFKLKDTYGLPLEEILLLAKDNHLEVHLEAFMLLENEAKALSRKAKAKHSQVFEESFFIPFLKTNEPTQFVGYDTLETKASIIGILVDGAFVERLDEGVEGALILDRTPFYAEMGGQMGDKGHISHHEAHFDVHNTTSPYPGIVIHTGVSKSGTLLIGEPIVATVDKKRRSTISQNHTATHLLHWALETVLGPHVRQTGSLVEEERLRFDFSHHKPLTPEEIRIIEERINFEIRKNGHVKTEEESYESVKKRKDVKQFFGDKYGEKVRVVDIDHFSKELCGGTHVKTLSEIGLFRIAKEMSIAAGTRRIEAVTGSFALHLMYEKEALLESLETLLGASSLNVKEKLESLIHEEAKLKDHVKKLRKVHLKALEEKLLNQQEHVKGVSMIIAREDLVKEELAPLAADLLVKIKSGLLVLGLIQDNRCQVLIRITPDLVAKGLRADDLVKEIAPVIGGSGGGKPENAQAGGGEVGNLDKALNLVKNLIHAKC